MSQYRKKPVIINAEQYTTNTQLTGPFLRECQCFINESDQLIITTLEGNMRADLGDYIIRGVKGEFYPCKPDIFHATYELINEEGTQ